MKKSILTVFSFIFVQTFFTQNMIIAQTCSDKIIIADKAISQYNNKMAISSIKVVEITKSKIIYKKCDGNNGEIYSVPKKDAIGIYYGNGNVDKFDYDKNNRQKNLSLVRKPAYFKE